MQIPGGIAGASDRELLSAAVELHVEENSRAAARLTMLAEIDRRGIAVTDQKAASAAAWWAAGARIALGAARTEIELGHYLVAHPKVYAAMAAGEMSLGHLRALRDAATTAIAADAAYAPDPDAAAQFEVDVVDDLLAAAVDGSPYAVARRGQVLAARAHDAARARHDADRARSAEDGHPQPGPPPVPPSEDPTLNRLTFVPTSNGRMSIRGEVDVMLAEKLRTALSPLSAPQPGHSGDPDPRPPSQRNADGLATLLEVYMGGGRDARPHVVGFVDLTVLRDATASGVDPDHEAWPAALEWSGPISAELARLVACDADLTVTVTDDGVPLVMGRRQRLVTPSLRAAVVLRDRCCVMCGRPAAWCEVHHVLHWANGGPTDLDNLALLCTACHRLVHRGDWEVLVGGDGHPWMRPPAAVDRHRELRPSHHRWRSRAA